MALLLTMILNLGPRFIRVSMFISPLSGKDISFLSYKTFNFATRVLQTSSIKDFLYLNLILLSQKSNFTLHQLQGHLYYQV